MQDVNQSADDLCGCMLLTLPVDLLCEHVLQRLDARTLAWLETVCKSFRIPKGSSGSLAELAARHKLATACGPSEAQRFKCAHV